MTERIGRQGFTLIEALVVVLIIGVLVAVLIPNLVGARNRALTREAEACAKQVATAQEIYRLGGGAGGYVASLSSLSQGVVRGCNELTVNLFTNNVDAEGRPSYQFIVQHPSGGEAAQVTPAGLDIVVRDASSIVE